MKDIQPVIERLLEEFPAGFRNKHLAQVLGISQARACQLLAARIRSGELARRGEGPSRYIAGPDSGKGPGGIARGARRRGFWRYLVQDCPVIGYVALSSLGLTRVRTRSQVQSAVRGVLDRVRYLVVDFEGVHWISETAAHQLFLKLPRRCAIHVEPINLEAPVAQVIWRVIRFNAR